MLIIKICEHGSVYGPVKTYYYFLHDCMIRKKLTQQNVLSKSLIFNGFGITMILV